jgi:hypothetical protein
VSKLWLDHDEQDRYRGVYEWDGPEAAEHYARSLWRVLDLVCPPHAVQYMVLPCVRRADVLEKPERFESVTPAADGTEWWRLVEVS